MLNTKTALTVVMIFILIFFALLFVNRSPFFKSSSKDDTRENLAGIASVRGQLKGWPYVDMEACIGSGGMAGCPPYGIYTPFNYPYWDPRYYRYPWHRRLRWRRQFGEYLPYNRYPI